MINFYIYGQNRALEYSNMEIHSVKMCVAHQSSGLWINAFGAVEGNFSCVRH
jgi:hypothetical protein